MKNFSKALFSLALVLAMGATQQAFAQSAVCTSTSGYNMTTGVPCNNQTAIPAGCVNVAGFSSSLANTACNGLSPAANGYGGSMVSQLGFLDGCYSIKGFSASTGIACNSQIDNIIYTGAGTTINTGLPADYPSLPTTGAGQYALINLAILIAAATISALSIRHILRLSAITS